MDAWELVWLVLVGLVVGLLGRLLQPGRDVLGLVAALAVGVGTVVLLGWLLDGPGFWGTTLVVVLAAVLVALVGRRLAAHGRRQTTVR